MVDYTTPMSEANRLITLDKCAKEESPCPNI